MLTMRDAGIASKVSNCLVSADICCPKVSVNIIAIENKNIVTRPTVKRMRRFAIIARFLTV